MTDTVVEPDWADLLHRWDVQQGVYVEGRERGYDTMLSLLDAVVPGDAVVVDLAAGPGSISRRLLDRRPDVRCLAVDADPVLLAVGRGALGDRGGRLRWVQADLRHPEWVEQVGEPTVDAVLSSTALHWLDPGALSALYRTLGGLIRPGGVLVNFDGFTAPGPDAVLDGVLDGLDRARQERAIAAGAEAWQDWWDAVRELPSLRSAFAERDRVFPPATGRVFAGSGRKKGTSSAFHHAALVEAGFAEVDVVWQDLRKKIVAAVR